MERKFPVGNFENFGTPHKFVLFSGHSGQCCSIYLDTGCFGELKAEFFHGMENASVIGQIRTLVLEVFLVFAKR